MLRITLVAQRKKTLFGIAAFLWVLQPGTIHAQSVLTQHNDLSRSGANANEPFLTTSNVNESAFGKLFSLPIDGFTYAQPLYDKGVAISGGIHNVIYVATAHDSVYAFDADSGKTYWHVSLGTSVPSTVINTQNILVEVGIISTPVIDASTGTIYVVAKTYESNVQIFRLHALDIATGAEKFNGPIQIAAVVSGSGQQSNAGQVPFVASQENQRAAITLVNGTIYLAFASHEDHAPYHGWLLGYNANNLQQIQVFNVTPNSGEGAIWMGGQGLVADSSNSLYVITGNSTQSSENASGDYGESFLKLVPSGNTLNVADYFKPNDYDRLNANDSDLGSGGAFAIAGTPYIAAGSKSGVVYVVDTTKMGKLNTTTDQVVQEFQSGNGLWGSPAFFNNTMYLWSKSDYLKAYQFVNGRFNTSPSSQSAYSTPAGVTSGAVSVSSNGGAVGTTIVWATAPAADPDHATVNGNLYAYDANNLKALLWSTAQNSARDSYGSYAKFVAPTVANGKVYVGTDSKQVVVYGLLASGGCSKTAITPYYQVNGAAWQQAASVSVASGAAVNLGPQPVAGGSWSWTGPSGFTSTARQINSVSLSAGTNTYIASYKNACGAVSTQTFSIGINSGAGTFIPNGTFEISSAYSLQAIDDPGFSTKPGQAMQQYTVSNGTNQQWKVVNVGSNIITLTSVASDQLLEIAGAFKANSSLVDQMPPDGSKNQQWRVMSAGAGTYELINVNSGLALDVTGGSKAIRQPIDQYPYQGNAWQKWIFTAH